MESKKRIIWLFWRSRIGKITVVSLCAILILSLTNVPKAVNDYEVNLLSVLVSKNKTNTTSFHNQIETIKYVQSSVFSVVAFGGGVPIGEERTVRDILRARRGLCYDRSWLIEKILTAYGFRTRHVFLLENTNKSFLRSITSRTTRSHAVTEVETVRGWMIVDSIDQWISLDENGNPVDFPRLNERLESLKDVPEFIKEKPFYIYGLYSRSGMMFKPFLPIPDVNVGDLICNIHHFY